MGRIVNIVDRHILLCIHRPTFSAALVPINNNMDEIRSIQTFVFFLEKTKITLNLNGPIGGFA